MNEEQQLRLQAFLDGELADHEARAVAAELAKDAEAAALATELRNTREAIKSAAPQLKLPESREFYWTRIAREIERSEPASVRLPQPTLFGLLKRFLLPAGAAAAVAIAIMISGLHLRPSIRSEMTIADSGAFTYQDFQNGTTLVWMSYPAESGFADNTSR